jgi:hypothetical protein
MMLYAKVVRETGEVLECREFPPGTEFADHKPMAWLPVREEALSRKSVGGEEKIELQVTVDLKTGEVVRHQAIVAMTAVEKSTWAKDRLACSDLHDMPRILEVLIDLLVAKGAIALADLPQAAQDKIAVRKALRAMLG